MNSLSKMLADVVPADEKEKGDLTKMLQFSSSLEDPFSRSQFPAHFTGSAFIIDAKGERVCLVHHAKLNRWLQPGGHSNPEDAGDMVVTALREALEETGLKVDLHPRAPRPFDVDVHVLPARKTEPEHAHLDLRFLMVARDPENLAFDPLESHGAQWFTFEEALSTAGEDVVGRMIRKTQRWCRAHV